MSLRLFSVVVVLALTGCVRLRGEPDVLECGSDDDCPSGLVCFQPEHYEQRLQYKDTCQAPDFCEDSYQCAGVAICEAGHCKSVECTEDSPCFPYVCGYDYTCALACNGPTDCAPGMLCSAHQCVERECSDYDPFGQQCGGFGCASGLCRTSCMYREDCAEGHLCETGLCRPFRCTGTPQPCALRDESTCQEDLGGCSLYDGCTGVLSCCAGTPQPCSAHDAASCESHMGCQLER